MDIDTSNIIKARFLELPMKLQDHILRPSLSPSIGIIAQKHNLPPEKSVALENNVMLVLLGFEPIESFEETIVRELLIPGSIAASITRDVNGAVFAEITPELQSIYKEWEMNEKATSQSQPAQQPQPVPQTPARTPNPLPQSGSKNGPLPHLAPREKNEWSLYGKPPTSSAAAPLAEAPRYGSSQAAASASPQMPSPPPESRPNPASNANPAPRSGDPYRETL